MHFQVYFISIISLIYCRWGILFSHPADYTPVCTTELGRVAKLAPEFKSRNCKLAALSCDSVTDHHGWIKVNQLLFLLQWTFFYMKPPIIFSKFIH